MDRILIIDRFTRDLGFIRGNLVTLLATWIILTLTYSMPGPYESLYIRVLGGTPFIIGLIGGVASLMMMLVQLPGSYIADNYGRKQIIVTMTFILGFSNLLFIFASDWVMFMIGAVMASLSLIYIPALQAITADSIPEDKRGLGFTIADMIPPAFSIFGPIIASFIVTNYGLDTGMRLIYFIIMASVFLSAYLRYKYLSETLRNRRGLTIMDFLGSIIHATRLIPELWRMLPGRLRRSIPILVILSFWYEVFIKYSPLYAMDVIGLSEGEWGLYYTILLVSSLVVMIPSGYLIDIYGRRRPIILGTVLAILGLILFLEAGSILGLIVSLALLGMARTIILPSIHAYITDMVDIDRRGLIFGVLNVFNLGGLIPLYIITGYLYELGHGLPFILLLVLITTTLPLIGLFIRD